MAAATLTGSEGAGRAVAAVAGDEVKPTVLELGGSDPFVVMPSAAAELDHAVATAVTARVQNNGQSCIAAKRFIVHEDIHDEFAERFTRAMSALVVGDPTSESTDVGPLSTEQGRADLEQLVGDALSHGAEALCGARRPKALPPGWYYEPTVLTGVTPKMRIHREEAFGPVATLYRVPDLDAAVALANDTPFGLSSNVWTRDEDEQRRFVRDLEAAWRLLQRNDRLPPRPALRRREAVRLRARAVRPRHPRLLQRHHRLVRPLSHGPGFLFPHTPGHTSASPR